MSWEAHRWTAKTPSELYHVLGPHGVDDLIRQSLAACWRDLPEDGRSLEAALARARDVYDHHVRVWRKIKQPTPEAFFADLRPTDADGYFRQAMVLCWMMMPRTGGRVVADALRIVTQVFERNLAAWEEDNATFTGKPKRKPRPSPKKTVPTSPGKGAAKTSSRGRGTQRKKQKSKK